MERDQGVRCLEGVGGTPRPRVGCEIGHDPRTDRIPVEGPEPGEGGGVLLDETRLIAPLPEVAPPSAGLVEGFGGFRQNPPERSAEGLVRGGLQKTVHVSGHQRGGVHRDLVRPDQLTQMGEQEEEVFSRGKVASWLSPRATTGMVPPGAITRGARAPVARDPRAVDTASRHSRLVDLPVKT